MTQWRTSVYLPRLASAEELGAFLRTPVKLLYRIANDSSSFYRLIRIPKRSGGFRLIEEPRLPLKRLQRRILRGILSEVEPEPAAAAFRPGRGICEHARLHVGQPAVLTLDVENFFPSLKRPLVYRFFRYLGYDPPVAALLAALCCREGHLPQGAPTSPALSNFLLLPLDRRIVAWIGARPIAYSRYADDLTLSGQLGREEVRNAAACCRRAAADLGLKLNARKFRVRRQGARQLVTGLVVNESVRVPREQLRRLRQVMHYLERFGWRDCAPRLGLSLEQLIGQVCFVRQAQPEFAPAEAWLTRLRELCRPGQKRVLP